MRKWLLISLVVLSACAKQSLKTTYDQQTTYIESFVDARMKETPDAVLTRQDGAYRLTLSSTAAEDAPSLQWGHRVKLDYGCFVLSSASLSSGNLVSTTLKDLATQAGWTLSDESIFQPVTLTLDDSLVEGLSRGLTGVKAGDVAYILFTGEYGYGKSERGTIPALSALAYYVQIEEIDPNE
ncbi:MAG: FKBP-type peptidyl-prolyl cis-trans isomerase [Bacteroidales bacterium]|nr:FKBP-type peptidyl-prolyl cis-trans isomerase [Bacteroidales bacterium]